ncbi:hypothetical protein PMAYCL1PPCAC_06327, partial [Pristionchus mayeri]
SMLRAATLLAAIAALAAAAGNGTLASSQFNSNCAPSFLAQTKKCLDTYFAGYGLNPAKLPPYKDYVTAIVDWTTQYGCNGVDKFCALELTVENCLGTLFNSACMTSSAFEEMYGMSTTDAWEYATDFPVRAYMCDNKQFAKDNNDCFDDVITKHLDERRSCTTAVEEAIKKVTDGDYCRPWGDFVSCNDDVYVKYCGKQVKGYICNVLEVGINFDSMNQCKSSLPTCGSPFINIGGITVILVAIFSSLL